MSEKYDSRPETEKHIARAAKLMNWFCDWLKGRACEHDKSKLHSPEKEVFDEYTPKLKGTTYGSPEYKSYTAAMGEAIKHHYAHNRHHPEHFGEAGIGGMTLVDLVEMFCDWKAASERHADGDIMRSIKLNADRFKIPAELVSILENTAEDFGWTK